jgi:hypothetical protein
MAPPVLADGLRPSTVYGLVFIAVIVIAGLGTLAWAVWGVWHEAKREQGRDNDV